MNSSNGYKAFKIMKSLALQEGAGVTVNRVIGTNILKNHDPFLMLDFLNSDIKKGFPDHPHRGFETVSYMIDGKIVHEDFKGHKGVVDSGDVQWMTAGKGILHSEMPESDEYVGKVKGFQLWVNLPKKEKMCEPFYQEVKSKDIPVYEEDGVWVKVIAGKFKDKVGPCKSKGGNISYFHIRLYPEKSIEISIGGRKNGLIFVFGGEMKVNNELVNSGSSAVFYEQSLEENMLLSGNTKKDYSEAIIFFGDPIKEPIVQYGPFVMTTNEEIEQTFEDFQLSKNGFEGADTWKSVYGNKKKKKDL
jgi:redox-sensitive bicupin YhaK (pirin superfamily)